MDAGIKLTKRYLKKLLESVQKKIYVGSSIYVEEFKQIKLHNLYVPYIVSSAGRVFSVKETKKKGIHLRELHHNVKNTGYAEIVLTIHGESFYCLEHRLVALMFIKNDDKKHKIQVNHKNGVKTNNWVYNLEWITPSDNVLHAYSEKLILPVRGERCGTNKYSEKSIRESCELITQNMSFKDITKITGVPRSILYCLLQKSVWPDVVVDYDFSDYTHGISKEYIKSLHKACKLLEENELMLKDISRVTGLSKDTVYGLRTKRYYPEITKLYKVENYTNKRRSTTIPKGSTS